MEGVAEHRYCRPWQSDFGRDRRPWSDSTYLANDPSREMAELGDPVFLGWRGNSVRRSAARRFFLKRVGYALQYRFASDCGEPGRRIQLLLGNAVSQKRTHYARKPERRSSARLLLPDYLCVNGGSGRQGLSARAVQTYEPDSVQRGSYNHPRHPRPSPIRRHL